jgi:hypothetical protein
MKKYNIEGGLDFYSELYKSLDVEENEHKTEEDANLCLITNQPLIENYFEMSCGHKFNYLPLYYDLKNHKQKFNGMESTASHLKLDEIRCPYCRKKHKGVLPYYEDLGLAKINGVNDININLKMNPNLYSVNSYKPCQYLLLNPNFDQNGNNIVEVDECNNGNCKFLKCYSIGSQINYSFTKGQYKNGSYVIDYPMTTIADDKYYCWTHKKQMIKKYKSDIINKAKDEIQKIKLKEKEDLKKTKEEAKQNEKELKQAKAQLKKLEAIAKKIIKKPKADNIENVVIGIIDLSGNTNHCLEILKTGAKKGECCGGSIFSENLCKRHYNLKTKIIEK